MSSFHYGWVIVAFTVLMQIFSLGIFLYSFGVVLIPWTHSFQVSRAELTMIPVTIQVITGMASPFVGHFIDRLPTKPAILIGIGSTVLSLVLLSQATSFWQVMLISVLPVSVAVKLAGPLLAQAVTAKWFRSRLGLALAVSAAGGAVGGLVMPPIIQWMISFSDWRTAYLYLAAGAALIFFPAALLLREPPLADGPAARPSVQPRNGDASLTTFDILFDRIFLFMAIGMGTIAAVQLVFQYNLPAIGHDNGISPARSALLLSALSAGSIVGKPVWGVIVDRVSPHIVYLAVSGSYLLTIPIAVGAFGPVGYVHLLVAALLGGFAAGSIQPLLGVVLVKRFGAANIGKTLGLAYPFLNLSALGPVVAAYAYSQTGSYNMGLLILTGCILMSAVVIVRSLRMEARPEGAPAAIGAG
jgi:MFS family permease